MEKIWKNVVTVKEQSFIIKKIAKVIINIIKYEWKFKMFPIHKAADVSDLIYDKLTEYINKLDPIKKEYLLQNDIMVDLIKKISFLVQLKIKNPR